ncbi:glycosyltransferase family 4 protein [Actinokineospora soli]|uniref:Glycosyltransferase family 4 protein n=1 Tax=Actinokineospora soli TaxID=1048753 RepID=A0ABW2TYS5_9PSEU
MRTAVWSPLPPARSGIADYTYELLSALKDEMGVSAVARTLDDRVPPGVELTSPRLARDNGGVPMYHMGNHAAAHEWIYREALAHPGVVVLHDTSLMDFHAALLGGVDSPEFRAEVLHAHGPILGAADDPALIAGLPAIDVDGVPTLDRSTLTMERRLIESSLGVIVHDEFAARWLAQRYPGVPAEVVPSGAPVVTDPVLREALRARLGWREDDVVFGVFGGFNRIKRALVAVLAFAQVRRRWPQAKLLIVGHADDKSVLADVEGTIAHAGVGDSVHIAQSPSIEEFEGLITASDVVVNLRWPTAGETSAVMMRAFGAGRAVITSDLPQHRHFPEEICHRIPTDPALEAHALLSRMEQALVDPDGLRAAGDAARRYVEDTASWPVVARRYREAMERIAAFTPGSQSSGVNVFADARATTGLAEAARRHAVALAAARVPMTFTEVNSRAVNRSVPVPAKLADLPAGKDHPVDLWLLNLNEFQLVPDSALDRYTIGLWAWELPAVLDQTLVQVNRLDELWVTSSFVAETFRTVTDIPITVVPNVVPDLRATRPDRARFGIPADGAVVLFTFSASSSDARKNPWAAIEAFRRAFDEQERGRTAHLVVKVVDLDRFPKLGTALTDAVTGVGGRVISADLSRDDFDTLLASCDVYLSLHRSEGFGLGMAEAMSMGKAVVATGFGGNTDFMPPGSAAVVGYQPKVIDSGDHHLGGPGFADWYQPGQLWAEPDVDQAARWLRALVTDDALRRGMGERAAEAIAERCGPDVVGRIMATRLAEIAGRYT